MRPEAKARRHQIAVLKRVEQALRFEPEETIRLARAMISGWLGDESKPDPRTEEPAA